MPAFDRDRQSVIEKALDARIALINSGISLRSNQATKDLLQYENVYAAYGLSPLNLDEETLVDPLNQLELEEETQTPKTTSKEEELENSETNEK